MNKTLHRPGKRALPLWLLGPCLGLCLTAATPAAAADAKDGQAQVRALQQRMRAAEQDKARLVQEKTELDGQVKDSFDKLASSKRNADAANRQRAVLTKALAAAAADRAVLADKLAALELQLAGVEAKRAETEAVLGKTSGLLSRSEAGNRQLGETLVQRGQSLAECSAKNENLYRVGASLLGEFEAKGTGSPLEAEPLTRLARVAIENRAEEYRDLLDAQQVAGREQARHEQAQRHAASRQLDQERAARDQVEQHKQTQAQGQQARRKQQSELDQWTRKAKSFFENIEW